MIVDLSQMNTGVCDRLRAITCGMAKGLLTGENCIYIYEKRTQECPELIINMFSFDGFHLIPLDASPSSEAFAMNPMNSFPSVQNAKVHMDPSSPFGSHHFLLQWMKAYGRISLKEKYRKMWYDLGFGNHIISYGIHVRITDRLYDKPAVDTITPNQYYDFIHVYLPKMEARLRRKKQYAYIASDSRAGYEDCLKILGDRVINQYDLQGWDEQNLRQAPKLFPIDLYALSQSRSIVSTTGGGVPLTACLMAGKPKNSYYNWSRSRIDTRVYSLGRMVKASFLRTTRQ